MIPDDEHPQPLSAGTPLRRLWPFVAASRRDLVVALGAAVIGQGSLSLVPLAQRVIVDGALAGKSGAVAPWLVLLVVIATLSYALAYTRRWVGGRIGIDVQHRLRTAIFDRLMRLDFAGHDQLQTGQIVSRATGDLNLIQQLLGLLPMLTGNLVLATVAVVVMVVLSPLLSTVVVLLGVVMLVLMTWTRRSVHPSSWDAQQRLAEVAGAADEAIAGVRIVKGFGAEDREIERVRAASERLFRARMRMTRIEARVVPTLGAVPAAGQIIVLGFGGWLALEGRLSLGTYLAFSSYLLQLVPVLRNLSWVVIATQQARAGAERVLDILDANADILDPPEPVQLESVRGEILFDDVTFGYRRSEPVLEHFTLQVSPGEIVALVGGSGSGKTTVGALLPRFYDPAAGRVCLDGIDVRTCSLASLRAQVGVVFEEAFLFSDTIRANVAYGRADATDEQVRRALEVADAWRFVAELPDGLDTVVGERGLSLSGGQRQRVALARAIVSDPAILVLDDATSAVDTATEESIHDALRHVLTGRTALLIAHRASTVRLAGRVVVLDAGRVVDEGTHDELMARNAEYRAMLDDPTASLAAIDLDTPPPGGVTSTAWPALAADPRGAVLATLEAGQSGRGTALSATPELLAALERLPVWDDPPDPLPPALVDPPDSSEPFHLLHFIRPWRRALAVGLAFTALEALLTALAPMLIRRGIDAIQQDAPRTLAGVVATYVVLETVNWFAGWGSLRTTARTAERILYALRVRVFTHLQRLSLDFYDHEMDGRILTRMTSDIEALTSFVMTGLLSGIVAIGTCVGVAVFLVVLSPLLALVTAAVVPPIAVATWAYRRSSRQAYRATREAIADVNANLQENLSGVRVTQAYGRERANARRFASVSDTYRDARLRSQRLIALFFPGIGYLSDIAGVLVLGAGSAFVAHGRVSPAVVIAFLLYLNVFFGPITQLSMVFDTWQQARAATEQLTKLLSMPSLTPTDAEPVRLDPVRGEIEFRSVHHRYGPDAAEALSGVELRIAAGEMVALVGETGAGKSTVVRLIARFHDPTEGAVLIDGVDLRRLDLTAYRQRLGIVPQEPFMFTGTLRDNIAFGRPDAADADVERAARSVGAHRFIAALPHGYRSAVTERGRSLSAGQRQLIALARAELVDPAILLLDEATANLDLSAEATIREAMSAVSRHRTTVLVAHRLETARVADRIVVLDRGRVAEVGPHEELLARHGVYARLWAAHEQAGAQHRV